MTTATDPRIDRLYKLMPAIYRFRDADQQYALQALLRVIAEQVNVVEDNIGQLYEDWFIETAEDWVVPYIAALIGYKPVLEAGTTSNDLTTEGRALNRVLIPRREVANTIAYRRRKGTLAVLDQLAGDVAAWPARAVEFFKTLGWNQNLNHLHLDRARTVDVRRMEALDLIDSPFDSFAHSVDIRRVDSTNTAGRYNIPSVGVFVWRLKQYSVTKMAAYCAEDAGPECYTFSVLGQDTQMFINPVKEKGLTLIDEELAVPAPIRRCPFKLHTNDFYGPKNSLAIWADGWPGSDANSMIPESAIVPADLSNWQYVTTPGQVAVDPVRGRFAFPPGQLPKKGVRVLYHYGFSADIGGGEYQRDIFEPVSRKAGEPIHYYVGKDQQFHKIGDAITQWTKDAPLDAVIELSDSAVYVEALTFALGEKQTLQLRAANGVRPVIRMVDWQTDAPDALSVTMQQASRFTLDGILVTGRPLSIAGPERKADDDPAAPICGSEIIIRHCTLVPGWAIDCDCNPKRPAEPSIELFNVRAKLCVEHSIVGAIQINEDQITSDPIPVCISDTILDATDLQREAIGAPGLAVAKTVLTIERTTVFGIVNVHAIELAENSILMGCLNVARRQIGCMRFCYVPPGCRTPKRYHCQPDLVIEAAKAEFSDLARQGIAVAGEKLRVKPQFTSSRCGNAGYAQLGRKCAAEIVRGAEDESEIGVFHDLFQPQRQANLTARIEEYTPAGMDAGIIFVT
jgi:hypothetical protein